MMRRVSLSQLKSNLVGRRHSSDSDSNKKASINSPNFCNSSVEVEKTVAKELPPSGKKDLRRSNNLFRVLKCKWKNKRGTNKESAEGASALPLDGQELFVPKKLRSKIPDSSSNEKVVCPSPSEIPCGPLNNDSDDEHEGEGPLCSGTTVTSSNNLGENDGSLCNPAAPPLDTPETDRMKLRVSSQQLLPEHVLGITQPTRNSFAVSTSQRSGSLTKELFKLSSCGWYWGPITRSEAEEKLTDQPDGAFLVRDSSDDRYLLSLSFRSCSNTLHTRIEHSNGLFSFYAVQHQPHFSNANNPAGGSAQDSEGHSSIVALIEESMNYSQSGVFCYSRGRTPDSPSYPVRLTKPVSRFNQVRTLQYLCRFVIRQLTRLDHIEKLPLPTTIKGYLEESHY